jgi:hypothetical protein
MIDFESEARHAAFENLYVQDGLNVPLVCLTDQFIIVSNTEYNFEVTEAFKHLLGIWSISGRHWYFDRSFIDYEAVLKIVKDHYGECVLNKDAVFPEAEETKYLQEVLEYCDGELKRRFEIRREREK